MKVKIAHLYYDLMNLYGENANIRAIEKKKNVRVSRYYL